MLVRVVDLEISVGDGLILRNQRVKSLGDGRLGVSRLVLWRECVLGRNCVEGKLPVSMSWTGEDVCIRGKPSSCLVAVDREAKSGSPIEGGHQVAARHTPLPPQF